MRIFFPLTDINADVLSLLSWGFTDVQTSHLQPTSGIPVDVPVPKNSMRIILALIIQIKFTSGCMLIPYLSETDSCII